MKSPAFGVRSSRGRGSQELGCSALTHSTRVRTVITRQHETNRRISTIEFCESGRQTDVTRTNEGTNGQTNRQLARGPSEPSGARKRPWGARDLERAWSRAITRPRQPRHYPQLSVCVLGLGFRAPSGARIRARATARHRDPNVRTSLGDTEHRRKGWRRRRRRGRLEHRRSIMWRLPSDMDRFHRFGAVSGLRVSSCDRKSHAIGTVAYFATTIAESVEISTVVRFRSSCERISVQSLQKNISRIFKRYS